MSSASTGSGCEAAADERRRRAVWTVGVALAGLVGSLWVYRGLAVDPAGRTLPGSDPGQATWFLKWTAWQLRHGHDPLYTHALYFPRGVSLAWNTLTPTLGVIAAPITLTVGAGASFSVLMVAAAPASAVTTFWWLRRHTRRRGPAALGALMLAFGPYVSGHLLGHLNLTFVALIPVALMLIEDCGAGREISGAPH